MPEPSVFQRIDRPLAVIARRFEFNSSLIRAAIDASPNGILVVDKAGMVVSVNERCLDDHCEYELKDGRTLERHSTVLRGEGNQYLGRVWFFRDVTSRKQDR